MRDFAYLLVNSIIRSLIMKRESAMCIFFISIQISSSGSLRTIRVFSQTDDTIKYTLYPRSVDDILWRHKGRKFINEYQRYLLDYGVMQYLPNDRELDWADREYDKMMKSSNMVLKVDSSYLRDIASDMTRILNGEELHTAGYTSLIRDNFSVWLEENNSEVVVTGVYEILKRVLLTRKYFKGFHVLAEEMNRTVEIPGIEERPGLTPEYVGPIVGIVKRDGVYGYSNGYIPSSALEYLNPKPGYEYSGDTGSGFYKILIAQQECHVFCDMVTDGGGWMIIIAGHATSIDYLSNFGDTYFIKDRMYSNEEYGLGWVNNNNDLLAFQMYNMPFKEVRAKISGDYDNPVGSTGRMEFYTSSAGAIATISNNGSEQTVIADGTITMSDVTAKIENTTINSNQGTGDMNSLTVKIGVVEEGYFSRRYISELRVR